MVTENFVALAIYRFHTSEDILCNDIDSKTEKLIRTVLLCL